MLTSQDRPQDEKDDADSHVTMRDAFEKWSQSGFSGLGYVDPQDLVIKLQSWLAQSVKGPGPSLPTVTEWVLEMARHYPAFGKWLQDHPKRTCLHATRTAGCSSSGQQHGSTSSSSTSSSSSHNLSAPHSTAVSQAQINNAVASMHARQQHSIAAHHQTAGGTWPDASTRRPLTATELAHQILEREQHEAERVHRFNAMLQDPKQYLAAQAQLYSHPPSHAHGIPSEPPVRPPDEWKYHDIETAFAVLTRQVRELEEAVRTRPPPGYGDIVMGPSRVREVQEEWEDEKMVHQAMESQC
ncbi:hypothetical protein HK104_011187 [Borealophlyctis nickersoniae]|nr:hypothetical protein HK104_011187 [Borealophlyctis nickersoniae]